MFEDTKDRKKLIASQGIGPSLEGMGLNGYEKSDRGDGSPRLPDIKRDMNLKGFRVGSGMNSSDVIF